MNSLLALLDSPMLFGGSRIPELMKGLGSGMREFKKGLSEEEEKPKAVEPKKNIDGE